ncbi:MAG TPA: YceI family protein [Burkholderiaceae bacterium]|nr:YceI family protein [Burkholderiaceae bacterium]HQR69746.1 YceI family protein [Burkholderiaceae bacterium]
MKLLAVIFVATLWASISNAEPLDPQRSSIRVTARQMNVPFDGQFRLFNASLEWDERRPEASKASVEVDLSSFDLGDPSFNDEAKGKAFLDAARIPRATFTTTAIRRIGAGRYEATGKLGIKGVTRELTVPFSVREDGGRRIFEASFPLMRLDYRIGEGEWADTKTLANETTVQVRLVTHSAR